MEKSCGSILKAADELGYTLQGRGGRATPDWNSAGIIVPEVASEYYARLVHKAKDFLAAKGYSLIMKLTDFKAAELLDAIDLPAELPDAGFHLPLGVLVPPPGIQGAAAKTHDQLYCSFFLV